MKNDELRIKPSRHSGFVIPSCIVENLKSSFNGFGITNPKGQKRIKLKNTVTYVTFVTYYTLIAYKSSVKQSDIK